MVCCLCYRNLYGVHVLGCFPFSKSIHIISMLTITTPNYPSLTVTQILRKKGRNAPASLTKPIVCEEPWSLNFVTETGLMSTQMVFTYEGRQLPIAIECKSVPIIMTIARREGALSQGVFTISDITHYIEVKSRFFSLIFHLHYILS